MSRTREFKSAIVKPTLSLHDMIKEKLAGIDTNTIRYYLLAVPNLPENFAENIKLANRDNLIEHIIFGGPEVLDVVLRNVGTTKRGTGIPAETFSLLEQLRASQEIEKQKSALKNIQEAIARRASLSLASTEGKSDARAVTQANIMAQPSGERRIIRRRRTGTVVQQPIAQYAQHAQHATCPIKPAHPFSEQGEGKKFEVNLIANGGLPFPVMVSPEQSISEIKEGIEYGADPSMFRFFRIDGGEIYRIWEPRRQNPWESEAGYHYDISRDACESIEDLNVEPNSDIEFFSYNPE